MLRVNSSVKWAKIGFCSAICATIGMMFTMNLLSTLFFQILIVTWFSECIYPYCLILTPFIACLSTFFFILTALCVYHNWVHAREMAILENTVLKVHRGSKHLRVDMPYEEGMENSRQSADNIRNLEEAKKKIRELEIRIKHLEGGSPRRFPDVKFLNYRTRKRILVRLLFSL